MFVSILVQDFFLLLCIEASKNVIDHCQKALNAMGLPKLIKTITGHPILVKILFHSVKNSASNTKLEFLITPWDKE